MRFSRFAVLALPGMAAAFPSLFGGSSRAEMEAELLNMMEAEKREAQVGGVVGSLTNSINGLLGSVAGGALNPDDKRPEPGYVFKAPGPNDSRGPCPGLNLLANYGYLPRNGYVNYGQVVEATARGFNMGTDLSTVLLVFAILGNGNITTESFYLGSEPGTHIGGLNRHSTVEADISPNREDFYNGCGDNHHLSSRLFTQNVGFAAASKSKQFDLGVMGQHYAADAKFSQTYNPYIYFFPFPMIVSLGAFAFYPNFFGNGTYRAGGVANYESISSIIGAKYNSQTGHFTYVPERWPTNWYRRATPYGAVPTVTDILTSIYPQYLLTPGLSQSLANLNASTILCDIYQGVRSVTPLALAGEEKDIAQGITWALSKLTPLFGPGTTLGCPDSVLSPDPKFPLYPKSTQTGGPLATPSAQFKWEGDNVYNKVYFTSAPTKPQCTHSYAS